MFRGGLHSHVLRVKAAGDPRVRSAFYDGPSIGENRELVRRREKAQREFVRAHFAQGRQPFLQCAQVQLVFAFVDLHGVAPAQADGCAPRAVEINELAEAAAGTVRARRALTCDESISCRLLPNARLTGTTHSIKWQNRFNQSPSCGISDESLFW